ncbi:hypothetical protein ACFSQD_18920 [Flavihumibacter stibioxidans]|nr:hypothetical protein [Flavihumibacter stibioxidans]
MKLWLVVCIVWLGFLQIRAQLPAFRETGWHASAGSWSHLLFSPAGRLITPSMLAEKPVLAIRTHANRPFFISGLSSVQADASIPVSENAGMALRLDRYGNEFFRETGAALATGLKIGQRIGVGLSFGVKRYRVIYFGSSSVFQAGGSIHWSGNNAIAGFFIHSLINGPHFATPDSNVRNTIIAGTGIGRTWAGSLYTDINFYYFTGEGIAGRASLQYQILSAVLLAMQVETKPLRYGFEAGYTLKEYALMVTTGWQPSLGWSPGIAIHFRKPSKRKENE